jgi:hypothetical protein
MDSQAALLSPILFSTPIVGLSVALALLPLVLAPRPRFFFLLAMPMSLLCAYHFWPLNGLHGYGPRFLFEATPYLCALIGIAIITAWDHLPSSGTRIPYCIGVAALCAFNFASLKRELPLYKGYNGIDDEVARSVQRIAQKPSVVLIEGGSWQDQGYANMWIDPTLSDFVAIQRSPEVAWQRVLEHYPDHERYSIAGGTLSPVTSGSAQDDH